MATAASPTFSDLRRGIRGGRLAPVYLLHGEESYYIDELERDFENLLPEDERDFNMYVLYAPETEADQVEITARRYPMMAERQVVIVKEVQAVRADWLQRLKPYFEKPAQQTVLVLCSRGAKVTGKEVTGAVRKGGGIVFEAAPVKSGSIDAVITGIVKEKGLNIEAKGLAMLRDYLGTDVAKMYNEIDKLQLILGPNAMITPEVIERHIGISKDYNNFELVDAIAARNLAKAFTIVHYFKSNPKHNPTLLTVAALFSYFSNLLIAHFTRDKSPSSLMGALGLRWPMQLRNYEIGMKSYNAYKTIEIISALRRFDANSKGIGSRQTDYDLLHDLMFRIVTAPGQIVID